MLQAELKPITYSSMIIQNHDIVEIFTLINRYEVYCSICDNLWKWEKGVIVPPASQRSVYRLLGVSPHSAPLQFVGQVVKGIDDEKEDTSGQTWPISIDLLTNPSTKKWLRKETDRAWLSSKLIPFPHDDAEERAMFTALLTKKVLLPGEKYLGFDGFGRNIRALWEVGVAPKSIYTIDREGIVALYHEFFYMAISPDTHSIYDTLEEYVLQNKGGINQDIAVLNVDACGEIPYNLQDIIDCLPRLKLLCITQARRLKHKNPLPKFGTLVKQFTQPQIECYVFQKTQPPQRKRKILDETIMNPCKNLKRSSFLQARFAILEQSVKIV